MTDMIYTYAAHTAGLGSLIDLHRIIFGRPLDRYTLMDYMEIANMAHNRGRRQ